MVVPGIKKKKSGRWKRSRWPGYEKGEKKREGERKVDPWPVGHLQGACPMCGSHEGFVVSFGHRGEAGMIPRDRKTKGNGI